MSFFFKRQIIARNYDAGAVGFPAFANVKKESRAQNEVTSAKNIAALFSSIFLSAIAYGILMVLIATRLEQFVRDEILMSVSSGSQIIAGIIFSRFLPMLGRRVGLVNSIYLGSAISAVCAILMYFYVNYFFWIFTIFLYGVAAFTCGVTRQTIMIDMAPKHFRAMMISCGGMIVAIGNSFGPLVLRITNTGDNFESFAISSCLFLISMFPLYALKKVETNLRSEKKVGLWHYVKNSPKIMFAGFCVNYTISSSTAFLVIYGIKIGMSQSDASLLLSVLLFGTIFSVPIGYISDLLNRRFLMIFSGFLSLICMCFLYKNDSLHEMYLILFLTFGCLMGMKLPAIVLINDKYKPTQHLAVNSAFSKFSLMGNIAGIFFTGAIMREFGAYGLWLSNIFILSLFLIFCAGNYLRKFLRHEINFSNFSFLNQK